MTEVPRVNFGKRIAHYEIYTWTLCHSYLHEKQNKWNSIPKSISMLLSELGYTKDEADSCSRHIRVCVTISFDLTHWYFIDFK